MGPESSAGRRVVWLIWIASVAIVAMVMLSNGWGTSKTKPTAELVSQKPVEESVTADIEIRIEDFVFAPAEVTVAPGTRVTWVNKDEAPHTATSTDDRFSSGGLDTDDKYSFVFSEKGEFPYYCALHPHMKGVIKVR